MKPFFIFHSTDFPKNLKNRIDYKYAALKKQTILSVFECVEMGKTTNADIRPD